MDTTTARPARAGEAKPRKTAAAKRATARKPAKRTPARRNGEAPGYSESAAQLIARGKAALGSAYHWAGEAGASVPRAARTLHLPDQTAVQNYVSDRPLILGAVGLGLGMAIGAMLPGGGSSAPKRAKRK